jgi:predicted lipoprotein with Yx(FWY)xxD motif
MVACGGGAGGYGAATTPAVVPTISPTPGTTTLSTATLLGASGFVAPGSNHTVYVLSGDTTTHLECTVASTCTNVWPPVSPPAGVTLSTGFTVFTRPDNGAAQLAYQGNLLYTYSVDSAVGQTNGQGIASFGGTWSVARP